ncbi:hypothetical protein [Chlorogloeopsis fritschii]|uniref:hypothetical protein n=1 Tax=Chlorogloeopsis fritschii TaxID=1124 RepID=UPI003BEED5D1
MNTYKQPFIHFTPRIFSLTVKLCGGRQPLFVRTNAVLALVTKHFDDMFGKLFLNFSMPWNRLRYFCFRILIPVMLTTMTNEYTSHLFEVFDQISSFHDTSSSATFRTLGIVPLVSSL